MQNWNTFFCTASQWTTPGTQWAAHWPSQGWWASKIPTSLTNSISDSMQLYVYIFNSGPKFASILWCSPQLRLEKLSYEGVSIRIAESSMWAIGHQILLWWNGMLINKVVHLVFHHMIVSRYQLCGDHGRACNCHHDMGNQLDPLVGNQALY